MSAAFANEAKMTSRNDIKKILLIITICGEGNNKPALYKMPVENKLEWYYSFKGLLWIGISLSKLCLSEIRVSVEITPFIS